MQCVGTLSLSMIGFAGAKARETRPPASRQVTPPQSTLPPRSLSASRDSHDGAGMRPADRPGNLGQGAKPSAGALSAHQAQARRMEAAKLETDWSQVVRRCMDGDSGAWAEMVRTHHKRVYGLCFRFTGNASDAEDLTQDVFLKIYSNLASFDAMRGSLPVWITTMTRNLLVDNFRRTRNQRATSSLDDGIRLKNCGQSTGSPTPGFHHMNPQPRKNWPRWCREPWPKSRSSCARL